MIKQSKETVQVNIQEILIKQGKSNHAEMALGQVVGKTNNAFSADEPVLIQMPNLTKKEISVDQRNLLRLPGNLALRQLAVLPELTFSLWAWDTLQLELGECALIAGEHPFVNTLRQVAMWYGAIPLLYLAEKSEQTQVDNIININHDDPDQTIASLASSINDRHGFAAIDLSGQAGVIDIVLHVLPQWGRLLFAGPETEVLTIDYYNNLHRSGSLVYSTDIDHNEIIPWINRNRCDQYIVRAYRILINKKMSEQLSPEIESNIL